MKNEDPSLLQIEAKEDENNELKYWTEKLDHEVILKSFDIDNEYYRKKYKVRIRKKKW